MTATVSSTYTSGAIANESTANESALADLTRLVTGRVLIAGTPDYATSATPWNVAIQTGHLAAVEVADAADVAAVVRFAGEHDWRVGVQATGHGAYAEADPRPSLLVLTHQLDELSIDPEGRSARVGAGVRWSRLIEAAAPHGLAGLAGSSPNVGVVGYLTGGGMGPIARTFGWASDQAIAFDVVTGDGELRRASATENPALFWGLRGGKGALGIVTAVETRLVPLSEMYAGCLYFDGADAGTVLHAWRAWTSGLPEQASTSVAVLRLPPLPNVPPPLAGRTTIAVRFAWVGDPVEGERALAPISSCALVIFGGLGMMPYPAMGMIHADPVDPMPVHEAATLLDELSEEAVETLLASAGPDAPCPQVIVELRLMGGTLARPGQTPSALCHRDAAFSLLTIGIAAPPVLEPTVAHAEALMAAMDRWGRGANLPNFAASADPAQARRRYDDVTFDRLGSLAASYDPHRVMIAAQAFRGC